MTLQDVDFQEQLDRLQLVAEKAYNEADFEPLEVALLDVVHRCGGAEGLWQLFSMSPMSELLFGEDELWPSVVEAVLGRARAWAEPAQAASAIGLAVRAATYDPTDLVHRDFEYAVKEAISAVLDGHVDEFRAGLRSPHAALRSAHGHALGRCRNATAQDAQALLEAARAEQEDEPLATFLLAFGVVIRRGEGSASAGLPLLEEHLRHGALLVRACAATALALAGVRLSARATEALAQAVESPVPVPEPWGWAQPPESTAAMAIRIFGWAETETPSVALRALAGCAPTPWLSAEPLVHLAFADGAGIPALGLVLDDLNEDQKVALSALANVEDAYEALPRFGLGLPEHVAPFLAGEGPLWKPLDVDTSDGRRRWHLPRIWRERMWGERLPQEQAVDAVTGGLAPDEILEAMCTFQRGVLLSLKGRERGPLEHERDQRLVLAVIERLVAQGFDPLPVLMKMAAEPRKLVWDEVTVAVCLLGASVALGRAIPEGIHAYLADGVRRARSREPLMSLAAGLSPEQREAIFARSRAVDGA